MKWTTIRSGLVAAAMFATVDAGAQVTNTFLPLSGSNYWDDTANWSSGTAPGGTDAVVYYTNNLTGHVTNFLPASVTINKLYYNDSGAAPDMTLNFRRVGGISAATLIFAGTDAVLENLSTYGSGVGYITFDQQALQIDADSLTLRGRGVSRFYSPLAGAGTIVLNDAAVFFNSVSSNYTGVIVVSNKSVLSYFSSVTHAMGATNVPTYIYDTAQVNLRDLRSTVVGEGFVIRGIATNNPSLKFGYASNTLYLGETRLETNGVIGWSTSQAAIDFRHDNKFMGTLTDDGNGRNVHFLLDAVGSAFTNNGTVARASAIVFGGTASYGGFTHLTANKAPDVQGAFNMYLKLTNGNDRLPVGTTMYLGGVMTSAGVTQGVAGAGGILILAEANQELAGLIVQGTGAQNRVVGQTAGANTLTLNIASGTNLYRGFLGGDGAEENNLSLVKKGAGLLNLTASSNTYTGTTKIEAGVLQINADQRNGGLITIDAGGTLGGTGRVGSISSSGGLTPGNSIGTLTSHGNVTLNSGSTLTMELQDPLMDPYDTLVMNGGILNLNGTPELSLSLYGGYVPNMGDTFTILSGFVGSAGPFDTAFDGTFNGKPDGGTFSVSGSTFQIDYNANDITLTVVPEPHTLGLLGLAALGGLLRRRIRR